MQNEAYDAERKLRGERRYSRPQRMLWQYGLTVDAFEAILATQDGACAICRTPTPGGQGTWHVDHDHACCPGDRSCGRCVRGLLCSRCNPMIGMAKDDMDTLRAAIDYLSRTSVMV